MGDDGYFAHESRDGSAFWKRVQRFYGQRGTAWSVGENLLWSSPRRSTRAAVELWMDSPGHRRNILTARWREIGMSAVNVAAAPGVFGGNDVDIITTDFGVRSLAAGGATASGRAPVAQWTERRPSNPLVGGSNPPGRTSRRPA